MFDKGANFSPYSNVLLIELQPLNAMKTRQISQINEAVFVLRHFIELSAKLLPFLEELQKKRNPTPEDRLNTQKIIDVYESYSFDTNTSKLLINSNVLELIKNSFDSLTSAASQSKRVRSNALKKSESSFNGSSTKSVMVAPPIFT